MRHRRRDGCSGDRGLGCRCAGARRRRRRATADERSARLLDRERGDRGTGLRHPARDRRVPGRAAFSTVGRRRARTSSLGHDTPPDDGTFCYRVAGHYGDPMARRRAPTRRRSSSTRLRQPCRCSHPRPRAPRCMRRSRSPRARPTPVASRSRASTISVDGGATLATAANGNSATAQWTPAGRHYTLRAVRSIAPTTRQRRRSRSPWTARPPRGVPGLRPCVRRRAARRCPGRLTGVARTRSTTTRDGGSQFPAASPRRGPISAIPRSGHAHLRRDRDRRGRQHRRRASRQRARHAAERHRSRASSRRARRRTRFRT